MNNRGDNIKDILDEVHNSEDIKNCRAKKELIYENEFTLKKSEAYEGLKNSGMIKTVNHRSIVYTAILLLAIAGFIAAYVVQQNINDIIFAVISFVVLVVVWVVPFVYLNNLAKANVNGNVIRFKVYNDTLHILCNENKWNITLDNSNKVKFCQNVIIIKRIKDEQLFVIPKRTIEENKKEIVIDILKKGMLDL